MQKASTSITARGHNSRYQYYVKIITTFEVAQKPECGQIGPSRNEQIDEAINKRIQAYNQEDSTKFIKMNQDKCHIGSFGLSFL